VTTNDFWFQLHRLAGYLKAAGPHRRERLTKIASAWEMMLRSAPVRVAEELTPSSTNCQSLGN
jgi:hypothetical protein